MRRIVRFGLLLCWFASAALPAVAQQWSEDRPAGAGYRAEMPGAPQRITQNITTLAGSVPAQFAAVEIGGRAFLVMHGVTLPDHASDPGRVLDRRRDDVAATPGRRVREEQRVSVGGYPARRLVVDAVDGSQVIVLVAIMRDGRLYQVIFVGPPGSETSADAQRFIASFAFVPL